MPDPVVSRWKQQGHFYLWRFRHQRHGNQGWHFKGDEPACRALSELLDLMKNAAWPSRKAVTLSRPSGELVGLPKGEWSSPAESLEIHHSRELAPDHWIWELTEKQLILRLGSASLAELQKGILDVLQGGGDYSIGPRESPESSLWLWYLWK